MKNSIIFFIFVILWINTACTTKPITSDDILIKIQPPDNIEAPATLTNDQIQQDIRFLIYCLREGYAGLQFIPKNEFELAVSKLNQIKDIRTPSDLRDQIDQALFTISDNHLMARLNGKTSKYRDDRTAYGSVGKNFYTSKNNIPWSISWKKLNSKKIMLVSITGFPLHESDVWNGFLDQVEENLEKSDSVIIDLRGNGGGDDTTGLELAWLFYGKEFRYPIEEQFEQTSPATQAIYTNAFGLRIVRTLKQNKVPEQWLIQRYEKHLNLYKESKITNKTSQYHIEKSNSYETTRKHKINLVQYKKPIIILMDKECASSCESTIDAFEFHPQTVRIGQNTGGYIHFGNVGPIILPNSKVLIQIPTHFSQYYDKRFIERIGIKPDVHVKDGADALTVALEYLRNKNYEN